MASEESMSFKLEREAWIREYHRLGSRLLFNNDCLHRNRAIAEEYRVKRDGMLRTQQAYVVKLEEEATNLARSYDATRLLLLFKFGVNPDNLTQYQ
jgi:hypothetical protein